MNVQLLPSRNPQSGSGNGNGAQGGVNPIALPVPEENPTNSDDDNTTIAIPIQLPPGEAEGSGTAFGQSNGTSASPTAAPNGASACFPAESVVDTASRGPITLESLRVGDLVRAGPGDYSRVYMFTHRVRHGSFTFVKLRMADGRVVRMTAGHKTYANGHLVAARDVRRGDELESADGTRVRVASVAQASARGLLNPHTAAGDVVVDGFRSSTFTDAVPQAPAQAALAPARALHACTGLWTGALEAGADSFVGGLLLAVAGWLF